MTDKPENDYRKLNIRPEQLYRLRLLAAKRGISMIDMIEEMILDEERIQAQIERESREVKS